MLTLVLILANLLIFFLQSDLSAEGLTKLFNSAGALPYEIVHFADAGKTPALVAPPLTIFTSLFLHNGIPHLLNNMFCLFVFGRVVEARLGKIRFLGLYLLGGVVGAFAHSLAHPDAMKAMIGASGSIAALMGAFVILRRETAIVLAVWLVAQFFADANVAWLAHVGGFLVGLVLMPHPALQTFAALRRGMRFDKEVLIEVSPGSWRTVPGR